MAGCGSEGGCSVARRVGDCAAPGWPWWQGGAALVACGDFVWWWSSMHWRSPSLPRPGSVEVGSSGRCSEARCASVLQGASHRRLRRLCSVTPSGTHGCRASSPAASSLLNRLRSHLSDPSGKLPGGGAVAGAQRRRRWPSVGHWTRSRSSWIAGSFLHFCRVYL
jgi:hypothetical protein